MGPAVEDGDNCGDEAQPLRCKSYWSIWLTLLGLSRQEILMLWVRSARPGLAPGMDRRAGSGPEFLGPDWDPDQDPNPDPSTTDPTIVQQRSISISAINDSAQK